MGKTPEENKIKALVTSFMHLGEAIPVPLTNNIPGPTHSKIPVDMALSSPNTTPVGSTTEERSERVKSPLIQISSNQDRAMPRSSWLSTYHGDQYSRNNQTRGGISVSQPNYSSMQYIVPMGVMSAIEQSTSFDGTVLQPPFGDTFGIYSTPVHGAMLPDLEVVSRSYGNQIAGYDSAEMDWDDLLVDNL
jgi:hypothetical protein